MKTWIPFFLLAALPSVWAATTPATPPPVPVLHPKAALLSFPHQGPFVTTSDGGVLAFDAKNALHSQDEGKTWTTTPLFQNKDSSAFTTSNERALLRTRSGVVIAAWMNMAEIKSPKGWHWGEGSVSWKDFILPAYTCRSLDDGRTWETPVKLSDPWCGCVHSMIELKSGRIVLVSQEIIPEWRHATVMFVSDDQGKTWQRSNMLDYGVGRHDHAGSLEGTVVERKDGSLYLLLRTEAGVLYEATSADGLKWEGLKPTTITSVTCCPQMMRLNDGRVAMLWNHPPRHDSSSRSSREELFLTFSDDDARTWSKPVVVAGSYGPGRRVSYPYLYERHPGEFWITTMQGGLRMKIHAADLSKAELPVYVPPPPVKPKPGGIIMFGDSTTAPRGGVKKVYSTRVQDALESVGSSLVVYNAGVPGNTTRDARKRLSRDVLEHQPRVVVIQFGINDSAVDVWKKPPATQPRVSLADYEANLRAMIEEARQKKAKVILMTTNPLRWTAQLKDLYGHPPYRPEAEDGFDAPFLAAYNDAMRKLAGELDVPLVDVRSAYPDLAAKKQITIDEILLDGMHPGDAGHQLVAELLVPVLRAQLQQQ